MSSEAWHKGYQEVRNVIHNEMGVTKQEILEIFKQIARDEIQKILHEQSPLIYSTIMEIVKEQIQDEMYKAILDHKYPRVTNNVWHWGYNGQGKDSFKDYVAGVMKEEVIKRLEDQFSVNVSIDKKESE